MLAAELSAGEACSADSFSEAASLGRFDASMVSLSVASSERTGLSDAAKSILRLVEPEPLEPELAFLFGTSIIHAQFEDKRFDH